MTGFRLPDGSRSAESPFVWRLFVLLSFVALGLCLVFSMAGRTFYAVAWGLITAGWFTIAMWLWRRNVRYDHSVQATRSGRVR